MDIFEAISILGLSRDESWDETVIAHVWKKKIFNAHPDKNLDKREESTKLSQRVNEARDMLQERLFKFPGAMGRLEWELTNAKEEEAKRAREKKMAEQEKKRAREEEEKRADEEEKKRARDKWMEEDKAKRDKRNEIRRAKYIKTRRKREPGPGTRMYRNFDDYEEGQALVQEMKTFFQDKFVSSPGNKRLLVQDVLDLFVSSRDTTTELEKNLFTRHGKKLFLAVWPEANYCFFKGTGKRCFWHVDIKK